MRRILVVRLSSLGDLVLTQPVLAALALAGEEADLLVKPAYAELARMLPGPARILTSADELAADYALALDLHGNLRARRALRGLRGVRVLRYDKRAWARRLLVRWGGVSLPWNGWSGLGPDESVTAWYAEAAERAGVAVPAAEPRLEIPAWARREAEALRADLGLGRAPYAAFAPGAAWATKQWPLDAFGRLAAELARRRGLASVFVGGPSETGLCARAASAAGGRAVSAAGRTSLPVLAALLGEAALLACNDSGPMHLGLAAGAKVLAFFGPTVPEFGFVPRSPRARVLSLPLACRPCSLHGSLRCPLSHHRCLQAITPETALAAAEELLNAQ